MIRRISGNKVSSYDFVYEVVFVLVWDQTMIESILSIYYSIII